jgi:acyl-CoA synthetase (AMP-forming)/AMP-acid ligase II
VVQLTNSALPDLSLSLASVLQLDPSASVLEYKQQWYSWGDLATTAESVGAYVGPGHRVGLLLRNHPAQVGLFIGLLRAGATMVAINPGRGIDRVRADVASLNLQFVAGEPKDLEAFVDPSSPAGRFVCADLGEPIEVQNRPQTSLADGPPEVAVEMLTSGTTGPSKRVPLTYETFQRVLAGAKYYEGAPPSQVRLRSGVAIVNAPLVHLGGVFRILQCVADGRSFSLLEKFRVDEWADAVRRHRPRTASLVPAALRMVLEADLDPADLSSLLSVISGTATLAPEDADAFQARFGVPVLVSYAATEFGGSVAGWNLADHKQFWTTKRGSVGRAHPGSELRVVDPISGAVVPANCEGLLEVKTRLLGDDANWTRTTDQARIDEDGFVWLLGRADQVIIRGGFKVRPDDVRAALERDPRVRSAAVVGRDDARLGAVPVAAVELRMASSSISSAELLSELSNTLAPYEVPVELLVVAELPRTPSGKVDLAAVREYFDDVVASEDA